MATAEDTREASTSSETAPSPEAASGGVVKDDDLFNSFYSEVKAIEKRDSTLTPKQQIERLNRPGSTYFNLNPFDVLQIDPDSPRNLVKQKYRRMSILVHPDKNPDDLERAQKAFDALAKAYKVLENDEGYKKCKEIVDEATSRVNENVKQRKKQLKKQGMPLNVAEDEPAGLKRAVYVETCKLFADLERLRQDQEKKDMHERKRKAEEDAAAEEKAKMDKEWKKNYEESRGNRVSSWRDFQKSDKKGPSVKKFKSGGFRPPKVKMEKR